MSNLKERDRLETLERPVEEKKRAGRGLWFAAAALVVAAVAGVAGFIVFGGGEEGIDIDFTAQSAYVPAGAAELEGTVTGPVVVAPAPGSSYVPARNELRDALAAMAEPAAAITTYVPGRHELQDALAAPGIDFGMTSTYVPVGAGELETALAEPGIEFGTSSYVPPRNELEMALAEPSTFNMPSTYVPGPHELAEALAETQGSADQLQYR